MQGVDVHRDVSGESVGAELRFGSAFEAEMATALTGAQLLQSNLRHRKHPSCDARTAAVKWGPTLSAAAALCPSVADMTTMHAGTLLMGSTLSVAKKLQPRPAPIPAAAPRSYPPQRSFSTYQPRPPRPAFRPFAPSSHPGGFSGSLATGFPGRGQKPGWNTWTRPDKPQPT